ncbi:dimethylmenaquinone methyltransferase [Streptomyces sp. NPDC044780]|uniref:RraA family protein n=1 Tax=unclassified Streptomyces TaxID=2593676 RepID=UPI0033E69C2B
MADLANGYADFADLDVATVYEASKLECAMDPAIGAVWDGARVCGPAYPVMGHPGDNLWMHHAVQLAPAGSVIVATVGGHLAGYWGEVLAVAARAKRIAGLVIDGGVRDVDALRTMGFPVFARGVSVYRTGKHHHGTHARIVTVAGVPVAPGDLVLGDADGVLVLPQHTARATLVAARDRLARETAAFSALRGGVSTHEQFGLPGIPEPGTPA